MAEKSGFATTPATVTDRPVTMTKTDVSTRKESANPKEYSNLNDKAKITNILIDKEKFEAYIQEIDDEIFNSTALSLQILLMIIMFAGIKEKLTTR